MCIVCVEWKAGQLTNKEALKNLGEMISASEDPGHYYEVVDKIMDDELPYSSDADLDLAWQKEINEE